MAQRFQLPPSITASSWGNVAASLWGQSKRGTAADDAGVVVPQWTCREAVAVIGAMRELTKGTRDAWPLWYQYAAVAYGWSPDADELDSTATQADRIYPVDDAVALNAELARMVADLDGARHPDPRIALVDIFDRKAFIAEVKDSLRQDGARAEFKIPIPACKDPKTGRPTKPVRDRSGKWSCPGGLVTVDDPITAIVKSVAKVAVPVAIVLLAFGALTGVETKRRRDRRRR